MSRINFLTRRFKRTIKQNDSACFGLVGRGKGHETRESPPSPSHTTRSHTPRSSDRSPGGVSHRHAIDFEQWGMEDGDLQKGKKQALHVTRVGVCTRTAAPTNAFSTLLRFGCRQKTRRMSPKNASLLSFFPLWCLYTRLSWWSCSTNPHDDVSNLVCSLSFHSDSDKKFARLLHAQRADHLLVVTSGSEQINPTKNESSRAYYLLC